MASTLGDVDAFATIMLNATSFMSTIQGGLFQPNLFVTNQTLVNQLRTILSPHFTKFNKYIMRSLQNPMSYSELYALFSELNGTIDDIFTFAEAAKNKIVGYDLSYMKTIFKSLVAQDYRFFIKELRTNETARETIFKEILYGNSSFLNSLKVSLNKYTESQLEYFQNKLYLNDVNKIRYLSHLIF